MSGYRYILSVTAGCHTCHGQYTPVWTAKNAHGVAAQHAKRTGHHVWVESEMSVSYNAPEQSKEKEKKRHG